MEKYSRKWIVAALLTSTVVASTVNVSANTNTFKDVANSNSHFDSIYNLVERGVIKGYSDGTFRPDNTLTRGQAAKILSRMLKLDMTDKTQLFTDVPSDYEHVAAINALFEKGIISGYSDGTFRPNAIVTRGQLAKILVNAFELKESQEGQLPFTDVAPNSDLAKYVQTLLNHSITQGTSATTFSPTNPVTRGQMASFVVRAENVAKTLKEKTSIRVSSNVSINTIEPVNLQINDTITWPATISSKDVEQANEVIITFEHDEQGEVFDISNLSETITFSLEDSAYVISFEDGNWVLSMVPSQTIENVIAEGEKQKVVLTWDALQDVKTYIIYRAETIDGQYIPIGKAEENQYIDPDLAKGKTYYYKIASENGRAESEIVKGTANIDKLGPRYSGDYVVISNESLAVGESQSAGKYTLQSRQLMKHEIVPLKETFAFVDTNLSTSQVTSLYKVGDTKLFNLNNNATGEYYQDYATLTYIGHHAEVWVHNGAITSAQAAQLATEFDQNIYNLVTENFGMPTDIDGNGRVAILCFDIQDNSAREDVDNYITGYFGAADLYRNEQLEVPISNEMEIIYIDTYPTMGNNRNNLDVTKSYSTLVHEFQHLVTAVQERFTENKHSAMATWLDEGLSLAAEQMYLKRPLTDYIQYFNDSVAIRDGRSLLEWNNADPLSNYSLSYLFLQYLKIQANREDTIFKELILHEGTEVEAVESVIHKYIDPNLSFSEFMTAFRVALVLNAETGIYGFGGNKDFDTVKMQVYSGSTPNLKAGGAVIVRTNGEVLEPSSSKGNDITFTGIYK